MARVPKFPQATLAKTTDELTADAEPIRLPMVREAVADNPAIMAPTGPEVVNRSAMFLTYLAFLGDVHRTAAALNIEPAQVAQAAEFEGWQKKVAHLKSVRSDMGPDEFLRELNRVVNFVQAVRLRSIMDTVLAKLGTEESLNSWLTTYTKDTSNSTAKALLDVIKCCEAVHRLTYTALGDVPSQRTLKDGDSSKASTALAVLSALGSQVTPSQAASETSPETESAEDVENQPDTTD